MKLLVKSDDYGFTKGVTDGIIDGIKNGIITCTGLFSNMPSAKYAVERMAECPDCCFGIDINIVSGPCVSDPKDIPHLVDKNGEFIRSTERYKDPRYVKGGVNEEIWPYNECLIEACAQIDKYIELAGKKPEYVTGHSISKNAGSYFKAIQDAASRYGIMFSREVLDKAYQLPSLNRKPFTMEAQLECDVEKNALEQLELCKNEEFVTIGGHCGYLDDELLKYSTYTVIRFKDHAMFTSEKVKAWLKENNVQLVSFRDFKD